MKPIELLEKATDRVADLIEDDTYGVIQNGVYYTPQGNFKITLEPVYD